MRSERLLIDVGPAAGPHGARGIGRYVRGLVDCMEEWPPELRQEIWAVGSPGETLSRFDGRGLSSRLLGWRPLDTGWLLGRAAIGQALRRSHATVMHSTDPSRPNVPRAVRRLVTVYDLIPLHEPDVLNAWRWNHRQVYRWFLDQIRRADAIVAISETTAQDVQASLGVAAERIHVVYPVVETTAALPRRTTGEPAFLFVGGLEAHKQPQLAVESLAVFRARTGTGRLTFIGPSGETQREPLRALARQRRIADSVEFAGRITDSQLDDAFAASTALLAMSRREGFGLPPVEAAIRGVPVIAVDTPVARETVGRAATLVPPDPEAVAEAMADVRPPAPEAQALLGARFSRHETAEALGRAYESLLGGRPG
jgi:glycosyltransferase involved in cell wall biosynthesis